MRERASTVLLRVGEDGIADDVDDLRDAAPQDLAYVCFTTTDPAVMVRFGSVPYASAQADSQEALDLARDVHSLVQVRQRPSWQKIIAVTFVRVLVIGPSVLFLAIMLADVCGLVGLSDRSRGLMGMVMLPAVLVGLGCLIAFRQWVRVDYETQVLPFRRREIGNLALQGRNTTKWGLISGVALTLVGLVITVFTAWIGLKT